MNKEDNIIEKKLDMVIAKIKELSLPPDKEFQNSLGCPYFLLEESLLKDLEQSLRQALTEVREETKKLYETDDIPRCIDCKEFKLVWSCIPCRNRFRDKAVEEMSRDVEETGYVCTYCYKTVLIKTGVDKIKHSPGCPNYDENNNWVLYDPQ